MEGDSMRFLKSTRRKIVVLPATVILSTLSPAFGDDKAPPIKKGEKEPDIAPPSKENLANPRMVFIKTVLARYTVLVGDRQEGAKVSDPCSRRRPILPSQRRSS
jgi:hypothetical protein